MTKFADLLQQVNYKVNSDTHYRTDQDKYGVPEFWTEMIDNEGDCEDYALTKRKMLIKDHGVSCELLRLCICTTETGELHCVLIAHDEDNDWILDNRYPDLMRPSDLKDYEFVKVQIPCTSKWEFIDSQHNT